MTLMEVMVSVLILTVAVQILSSILSASISYTTMKEERGLAIQGAMNVIEEMHATPFPDIFVCFNQAPGDDPDGAGTAHGHQFDVPGLDPVDGQQFVGTIRMPEFRGTFKETIEDDTLGMPRDVNGDFLLDDDDHADDYLILPVEVIVRWKGRYGDRSLSVGTQLADVTLEVKE